MDEFGYDAATAKDIAKKAKPRYRQIIANDKKPSAHADGFRLSKKSAGRKSAFTQKGVCESLAGKIRISLKRTLLLSASTAP